MKIRNIERKKTYTHHTFHKWRKRFIVVYNVNGGYI